MAVYEAKTQAQLMLALPAVPKQFSKYCISSRNPLNRFWLFKTLPHRRNKSAASDVFLSNITCGRGNSLIRAAPIGSSWRMANFRQSLFEVLDNSCAVGLVSATQSIVDVPLESDHHTLHYQQPKFSLDRFVLLTLNKCGVSNDEL